MPNMFIRSRTCQQGATIRSETSPPSAMCVIDSKKVVAIKRRIFWCITFMHSSNATQLE